MVQTFPVPSYFCPRGIHTGPVMTLEPRRRRFHKNVDYYVTRPPKLKNLEKYHFRLLCSISEGMNKTEWKDVTENVDVEWSEHTATFVSNLSGRFWMIFVEKEIYAKLEKQLFLHYAKQIYLNTITPSYVVDVSAKVTRVSNQQ